MIRPDSRNYEGAQECGPLSRPRGVLVVDDNEDVLGFLEAGLSAHGFAVWLASGGREGVAVYTAHRTAIDVVLLDVRMPEWDGPETLAAIRAVNSHVSSCFMSGDTGDYSEQELLSFGAAVVFRKPFRLDELIAHISRFTAPLELHEP